MLTFNRIPDSIRSSRTALKPNVSRRFRVAKRIWKRFWGLKCSHFSYPNGDYTEREIEIVEAGGFRSARTTDLGWNTLETRRRID